MSFLDIFKRKEQRSFYPDRATSVRTPLLFPAEKNPTVAACIDKVSKTLSSLPIRVYEKTSKGIVIAERSDLRLTLENPSVEETPTLFYRTMYSFLYYRGNVYLYKLKSGGDKLVGYSLIDPRRVDVTRDEDDHRKRYRIDGRYYTDKDILHIPFPGEGYNGTLGISPIIVHQDIIELDNKLLTYVSNYFDNSVGTRAVINLGNSYPARKASMDQIYAEITPVLNKYIVGAANAGKPMVSLPDSTISKFDQTSNVQSELKSLMDMVERLIAQTVFSVPYEVINSEASKYDSLESKMADFLSSCIKPLGDHVCESFVRELSPTERLRYQIGYEYKNLLTTNTVQTVDYLMKEFQGGALTMNEVRKKLGMESMGEAGDFHFIPANLMPLTLDIIHAYMANQKLAFGGHNPAGDDKS